MLRAGVSFAAVMKLLGPKSPHMTMEYLGLQISSVNFNWRDRSRVMSLRRQRLRSSLVPASTVSWIPYLPPNMSWKCSVERCRTASQNLALLVSPTGSRRPQAQHTLKMGTDWPVKPRFRKLRLQATAAALTTNFINDIAPLHRRLRFGQTSTVTV
jgi:hypothetical protein